MNEWHIQVEKIYQVTYWKKKDDIVKRMANKSPLNNNHGKEQDRIYKQFKYVGVILDGKVLFMLY